MAFDDIKRKLKPLPSLEEIEGLSEPSIMDEYVKQNDPEQYENIEEARNIKMALESGPGLGATMGIGKIGKVDPANIKLDLWEKLRKATDPNFGKMDDIIKAQPTIDPNFTRLTPEQIEKFKQFANEPHNRKKFFDKLKIR